MSTAAELLLDLRAQTGLGWHRLSVLVGFSETSLRRLLSGLYVEERLKANVAYAHQVLVVELTDMDVVERRARIFRCEQGRSRYELVRSAHLSTEAA